MKMLQQFSILVALVSFCFRATTMLQAEYVEPENFRDLEVHEFTNQKGHDSMRLQKLVDACSKKGGGIVLLKASKEEYSLAGVILSSNVHLRLEAGVRIRQDTSRKGANVFTVTGENISVVGASPTEKAVIAANGDPSKPNSNSFRAVGAINVNNFWLANLFIDEMDTRFSTIMTQNTAINGTIEDITMTGAGPGWGLLQMQGGANIVARNLDGQGGFTLRLEQGSATAPGGIQNLKATNITGRHGRAAVLIAPKSKVNGRAVIENVESFGCQWAIQGSHGKEGGVFEQVRIKGKIIAHYDDHGSQFRTISRKIKNTLFLPKELQKKVSIIPGYGRSKFSIGPSSGAVKVAPVDWMVLDDRVTIERLGFPFDDPKIVTTQYLTDIVSMNGKRKGSF